jgi:hypothetical protein
VKKLVTIATCCAAALLLGVVAFQYRESLFFHDQEKSEVASPGGGVAAGVFVRAAGMGEWVS